ncbi:benzodiazapine receptor [Arthrobacter pascens]|uniref:TspO/MBR family protein n=1 Tax=Arthrobacter pascens TaxID=1677 RepID=UPI002792AD6C|nr:TspO/MBR family protein [Arthrobacter pascens]MDQ0679970.1 benzodiazapine receptor [Arthrobacter pascens]
MQSHSGESPGPSQPASGNPGTGPPASGQRGTAAQLLMLVVFLAASAAVAGLGSVAVVANVNGWFATADMPPWTPPKSAFGPVWTVLYIGMAVAAWLVWRHGAGLTSRPLKLYWAQLLLNLAWTPLFFGLYPILGSLALWLGLAVILALIVALSFTVMDFGPISTPAGILLLPYLSWVIFAGTLNAWAAVNN